MKGIKRMHSENKGIYNKKEMTKGITLIALVVTIMVLLILVRSFNINDNRGKWNFKSGNQSKRRN